MRRLPPRASAVAVATVAAAASSSGLRMAPTISAGVAACIMRHGRGFAMGVGVGGCGCGGWSWRVAPLARTDGASARGFCLQHCRGALNKFDAVGYAGRARNVANAFDALEMNLFDDPTGGLTAGPAEELSTTEIEHQVRLNVSAYSRSIFYLLYTPFVDVISVLLERGLAPNSARPGEVMCRWFTDGALTLQNPACVEEGMGPAAWRQLCEGLDAFYEDVEPVMPLTAAVHKHGLPEELLVPFLRQLAMDLLVPLRKRAVLEILPGLILGLANGRAPVALGFPTDNQRARATIAADLFLGVGQETGNTDLAYLGIQLLRANDIPVPFPKQKQLTNVFSAATRIQTDWQMRVSGQLVEVLPKWMEYYKKVHVDNLRAMKELSGAHATTAAAQAEAAGEGAARNATATARTPSSVCCGHDDGLHDYFSSHRAENLLRLSELERRVLTSVRRREVAWEDDSNKLYYRFRRRRPATEEPRAAAADTQDALEGVDAAEAAALKEKGRRKPKARAHAQARKEAAAEVKPKQRRRPEVRRTAATPECDDDASRVILTV
ncbi:uncharacterized protein Tco025E_04221 [Trypanosoma conorhini]|uniref:Uncharacterized protein n=1 Tax=Trypanosoma conorhini TaxID=83891 RepID=A0A422PNI1_9TRYP|nr:uncharacterized protein Tco025E_04221 [Trypanosoma conorhini]RNF19286.1 hypothetical protein Tco025E_04221 [Trypanosoma conorhini]